MKGSSSSSKKKMDEAHLIQTLSKSTIWQANDFET